MKNIGKYAEYLVLLKLLKDEKEAYPALICNQEDYDITIVLKRTSVIRLQVKSTVLQNKNKNNSLGNLDKCYDFLVIVVFEESGHRMFVLSKDEVLSELGKNKKLSTSTSKNGSYKIKDNLIIYENVWEKLYRDRV